jgi:hypothetical protein
LLSLSSVLQSAAVTGRRVSNPPHRQAVSLDEIHSLNMAKTVANALRLTRIDDIKSKAIDVVNTCISGHCGATANTSLTDNKSQILKQKY